MSEAGDAGPIYTEKQKEYVVGIKDKLLRDHLLHQVRLRDIMEEDRDKALKRARRFYVRARQVRSGLAQTATVGRWANCVNTSRAGMSGAVSRYVGGIEKLEFIAERLLSVQIENRSVIEVIQTYDSEGTFFYCDPPYIHSTRGDIKAYKFEMSDDEHTELAVVLNNIKGKVAISNYECVLMDKLYTSGKWEKHIAPERIIHSTKDVRTEALWVNYKMDDELFQGSFLEREYSRV